MIDSRLIIANFKIKFTTQFCKLWQHKKMCFARCLLPMTLNLVRHWAVHTSYTPVTDCIELKTKEDTKVKIKPFQKLSPAMFTANNWRLEDRKVIHEMSESLHDLIV